MGVAEYDVPQVRIHEHAGSRQALGFRADGMPEVRPEIPASAVDALGNFEKRKLE